MIYQISLLLVSFVLSLCLVFLFKKISEKYNFAVDISDGGVLKIHSKKISLLGGAGFALAFIIVLSFNYGYDNLNMFLAILVGGIIIFLLGFYDDIKWKMDSKKQSLKFLFLILCSFVPAIILYYSSISFNFLPFLPITIILTFLYIFGAINSINYQDGIDGLAGGLVLISLIGFIILGFLSGNIFALNIAIILCGALLGFMIFNFPPAKIFMGDSGAYFLGFMLAVLAMIFCKPYNIFSIIGAILIIGIPVFDGIYTNFRKIVCKQSLFSGDRLYYYDKLMQKYSIYKTLFIAYFVQAIFVILGTMMYIKMYGL
ncbi:MAG: hypothetical protein A2561_02480 [Candidatus Staskawiczbacteria bacterium RIFOXYD1_FULL_32_13]|uniref:Glycosyl transferase family 4 n=1 Tax=Candidatus Staskawiczbacteria bacterium RIFOXYD1_FULL_32_13 TaxID=1802234 RepID=A0A1G2JQ57_9BACT|nr:MAG: Glycosyl transferase [Parcubacteria group bacterium GW2011_GWC2_32_10]OGZ89276.1 MAG: hypothetical protein A2561_02480 [Candidatus Staskawiczbacteria bacterium RIFOXYD1_FULL_32_13]